MTNSHPLDPLSADEIRQAAAIVRRDRTIGDTCHSLKIARTIPFENSGVRETTDTLTTWRRSEAQ